MTDRLTNERMFPVKCPACGEVWAEENQGIGEAECPACWTRRITTERGKSMQAKQMNYMVITPEEWREKQRHGYAMVIGENSPTGWPAGTKTILDYDPQTGATVLVPVIVGHR